MGMELETLSIGGSPVSPEALRRLNFWLEAHGAWKASELPWHECEEILHHVLSGDLRGK